MTLQELRDFADKLMADGVPGETPVFTGNSEWGFYEAVNAVSQERVIFSGDAGAHPEPAFQYKIDEAEIDGRTLDLRNVLIVGDSLLW